MTVANTSTQTFTDNKTPDPSEIASRKAKLLQAIAPLEMGMKTLDDETAQAELETLIKAVEQVNPTRNPAKSPLRKGRWRLLYTESPIVLGRNRPGFVRPEKAWQVIDIEDDATEGRVMNEEEGSTKLLNIFPVRWSNVITGKIKGLKDGVRFRQKFEEFKLGKWFKVPFPANVVGWQDQTFLDDELRIARTHFGNVFVMKREE